MTNHRPPAPREENNAGEQETAKLFSAGDFTLHSGLPSAWKIDCDALTDSDISTIARMLCDLLPPFGSVEGVPRGGLRLASALADHRSKGPLLIVDDVLTTGGSMERHRNGRDAIGAVIFARGKCAPWIIPLFSITSQDATTRKDVDGGGSATVDGQAGLMYPAQDAADREAIPVRTSCAGDHGIARTRGDYDALERRLAEAERALAKCEREQGDQHEFLSQQVSEQIDEDANVPWMRCSPWLPRYVAGLESELAALTAERDRMAVDARRYRWLRAGNQTHCEAGIWIKRADGSDEDDWPNADVADAIIDAALAADQEKGNG